MIFKLKTTTETTKEVELELPAYFKNDHRASVITKEGIVQVGDTIAIIWENGSFRFEEEFKEILEQQKPCLADDFNRKYNEFLEFSWNVRANEVKPELA